MFSQLSKGFGNFVTELEASVAQNLPRPTETPARPTSPSSGRSPSSPTVGSPQSASQLADSALSSLRNSLKRNTKGDSRPPVEGPRSTTPRKSTSPRKATRADDGSEPMSRVPQQLHEGPSSSLRAPTPDDRFSLSDSSANTPDRVPTPRTAEPVGDVEEVPAKVQDLAADPALAVTAPAVAEHENQTSSIAHLEEGSAPVLDVRIDPAEEAAVTSSSPTHAGAMSRADATHDPLSPPTQAANTPAEPPPLPASSLPRTSLDFQRPRTSMDRGAEPVSASPGGDSGTQLSDVSEAYQKLQAEKVALERIVRSTTSLSGLTDLESFEDYLRNLAARAEMSMAEIKRLTVAHDQQLERIEEMRDTHRLEVNSQSEQINQLKQQLHARETAIQTFEAARANVGESGGASSARVLELEADLEKAKQTAKEEEEKRIKSVSLLKALRQKLVKAEKDKEEAERERDSAKGSENTAIGKLESDVAGLRALHEQQLNKLRSSYERETTLARAQFEREAAARKGQAELEAITTRAAHQKELAGRDGRVKEVEALHRDMSRERDGLFERLQVLQAEAESAREDQDRQSGRTGELEIQLREAQDQASAIKDELEHLRRLDTATTGTSNGDAEVARAMLVEAEALHLQRVNQLEARIQRAERDRIEAEEDMSKQLQERLREVERMRADMAQKDADYAGSMQFQDDKQTKLDVSEARCRELTEKSAALELMLEDARLESQRHLELQTTTQEDLRDHERRAADLETKLAELQVKETTLRVANKTLREELRKVQTGMLISDEASSDFSNLSSQPLTETNGTTSPTKVTSPGTPADTLQSTSGEEAVNFEYIRNVILQFLEHKEMRPHLVGVLGVILHFTPSEVRRLTSKAGT